MSEKRSLKYSLYGVLCDKIKRSGIKALSVEERTFWAALYSWGVLQCEGLHGFIFWFDKYLTREMAVKSFFDLDCAPIALAIVESGNLSLLYLEQTGDDSLSPDDFRNKYNEQLNACERSLYAEEGNIEASLEELAMSLRHLVPNE